jgi:outer membrane immunogenic protein
MKARLIHLGLAMAALIAAPIAANAADLGPAPSYKAPAYVAPSYFSWSGFYVGINGGYGFGESKWDAPPITLGPSGVVAGGTLGYNLQTGSWVWGIEGDFDWSNMKEDGGCNGGFTCEVKADWFATARGRIGYAGWNNFLPYITGGAAFAGLKASNTAVGGESSKTQVGWTVGAGVEYALYSAWSVKLEYLYADLGKFDCSTCSAGPGTDNVTFKTNIVRAGVNYRF